MRRIQVNRGVRSRPLARAGQALGAAVVALALSACRDDNPVAPRAPVHGKVAAAGVVCTATRSATRVTCAPAGVAVAPTAAGAIVAAKAQLAAAFPVARSGVRAMNTVVIGGQDRSLRLLSIDSRFNETGDTLNATMQLQNLLSQALGTTDGVSADPNAVQAYFFSGPTTADPGIVTVVSPDSAVFPTGSDRLPFYRFDAPIAPNALSALSAWKFAVPTTVTAFTFTVFVVSALADETPDAQQPGPSRLVGLAVSAFGTHACALRPTFNAADTVRVYCWGEGAGAGKPPRFFTTVPLSVGGYEFEQVFAHDQQRCGLTTDHLAYCWGATIFPSGFTRGTSSTPIAAFAGHRWRSLALGENHDCAIAADSTAWCFGFGGRGELGDGTTTPLAQTLVEVAGHLRWIALGAGTDFTCGIARDSTAYCWGSNDQGRLGTNDVRDHITPAVVSGGFKWRALAVGKDHACGITTTQAAYCWGSNVDGQLGNGILFQTFDNRPDSVAFAPTWTLIAAGEGYSCGVNASGTYCWGRGTSGQTGTGNLFNRTLPGLVTTDQYVEISLGWAAGSTCALTSTQQVVCWGDNSEGQLGLGFTSAELPTPQPPVSGTYSHLAMGDDGPCAISADGRGHASCWGSSFVGEIGDGIDATPVGAPRGLLTPVPFTGVVAGGVFNCALNGGVAYCWGENSFGEFGTDDTNDSPIPVQVGSNFMYSSLSAGMHHSCGLRPDGNADCWGDPSFGQLGDGTFNNPGEAVSVQMPAGVLFASVHAGGQHSCALDTAGAAWCWGANDFGQLGIGTAFSGDTRGVPTRTATALHFSMLSLGSRVTCGIEAGTGRLICWGNNLSGQLGLGRIGDETQPTPAAVPTALRFTTVSVGDEHACALTTSGFAYCWGTNNSHRTGTDPARGDPLVPTRVLGGLRFAEIGAGLDFTCATTADEFAPYCWGNPNHTGTGDVGNPFDGPRPVLLPGGGGFFTPIAFLVDRARAAAHAPRPRVPRR